MKKKANEALRWPIIGF